LIIAYCTKSRCLDHALKPVGVALLLLFCRLTVDSHRPCNGCVKTMSGVG